MEAYLAGLEKARENGHDLTTIHSVASFFVSRVDTEIDKRLDATTSGPGTDADLKGKAGVANARLAFQAYEEILAGERWASLEADGAHRQRPLWASTGVKNPDYRDTMYVDDLVVEDTVNTMPEATMNAVADHGEIKGDQVRPFYVDARRAHAGAGRRGHRLRRRDRRADQGGRREVRHRLGRAPRLRRARPSRRPPSERGPRRADHDGGLVAADRACSRASSRTCAAGSPTTRAGSSGSPSPPATCTSTCRRPASTTTCWPRCSPWPTRSGSAEPPRRDVRRRAHQRHRGPRRPAHRPAAPGRTRRSRSTARTSSPTCTRCCDRVYAFADAGTQRRLDRRHGRADPDGREHRHRRLRPRSGDGLRGARAVPPGRVWSAGSSPTSTRPTPPPRWPASTRRRRCSSSSSKTFGTLETLTNARLCKAWLLAGLQLGRRRRRGRRRGEALRRGLHRARQGRRLRHRPGQRVRLLGLGRRPLLGRLRDRHVAGAWRSGRSGSPSSCAGFHAIDEHFRTTELARQRPGADGPAQRLVRQLPRRPDPRRAALRAAAAPVPGVPPAADHGVQRQERALGRQRR